MTEKSKMTKQLANDMIRNLHIERHNATVERKAKIDAMLDKLIAKWYA